MRGTRQHSAQEAIRVHRCPSEAIRGNPRQSEAIRCNQRQSEAIRGHREDLCGNPRQTNATTVHRGHQCQSVAIRGNQRPSVAIRGHQRQPQDAEAINGRGEHLRKAAHLEGFRDRSSRQVVVQPQVSAHAQGGCPVCRRRPLQPLAGDLGQAALVSALELGHPCVQRVPDEGDHPRSSEVIRGHRRSSEVIRGKQRQFQRVPDQGDHQRSSEVIRGHQRSSEASRGTSSVSLMRAALEILPVACVTIR